MQALRDALTLLVVILVVATVRVSPVPEVELSPAHASVSSGTVLGVQEAAGRAPARLEGPAVDPAEPDGLEGDADCMPTLAVNPPKSPARPGRALDRPGAPCDV